MTPSRACASLEERGQTAAVVRIDGAAAALLGIADRMRPAAHGVVTRITAVTGSAPLLLTGDNQRAASRLAAQAGITDVRAGLLPQDKVEAVRALQAAGGRVLLVATASTTPPRSRRPHRGRDGPGRIRSGPGHRRRGDHARRPGDRPRDHHALPQCPPGGHRQPAIAATIIAALVIWDLAGHLPLPLGVLGHEGSTVIVGLNGLRLLRQSAWTRALRG